MGGARKSAGGTPKLLNTLSRLFRPNVVNGDQLNEESDAYNQGAKSHYCPLSKATRLLPAQYRQETANDEHEAASTTDQETYLSHPVCVVHGQGGEQKRHGKMLVVRPLSTGRHVEVIERSVKRESPTTTRLNSAGVTVGRDVLRLKSQPTTVIGNDQRKCSREEDQRS
jgi:hypothetical protein